MQNADKDIRTQINRDLGVFAQPGLFALPALLAAFYFLSTEIRHLGALFWAPALVMGAMTFARMPLARSLAVSPPDHRNHPIVSTYVWLAWLTAASWGATLAFVLDAVGYTEASYILIIATAGIAAGSVSTLGVSTKIIVPYTVVLLAPLLVETVRLWWLDRGHAVMPVMTLMFAAFIVSMGTKLCGSYQARLLAAREARTGLAAATAATDAKSRFLASVSHEIRTPMNGIIGVAHLLKETELDEEQEELLATMESASHSLLRIINDVLDLSKVEAGKLDLVRQPFSPITCTEEVISIIEPAANAKRLELSVWFGYDVADQVVGDVGRVQQILLNLLNNAVKFTTVGGVHVEVERRAKGLRFTVTDTGPGLERDFEPFIAFSQGKGGRRHGGTGLGLTISHRLAHLMGGDIGFERPEQGGTSFWFEVPLRISQPRRPASSSDRGAWVIDPWLPSRASTAQLLQRCGIRAEPAPGDAVQAPPSTDVLITVDEVTPELKERLTRLRSPGGRVIALTTRERVAEVREGLVAVADHVTARPLTHGRVRRLLGADAGGLPPRKDSDEQRAVAGVPEGAKRILIVEDNRLNQMLAQRFVQAAGFHSEVVGSGREALTQVAEHRWDAILMDCRMPDLDGWATTRAIRERESTTGEHVPIIAMTADVQDGARDRCLDAGMDDYLSQAGRPGPPSVHAARAHRVLSASTVVDGFSYWNFGRRVLGCAANGGRNPRQPSPRRDARGCARERRHSRGPRRTRSPAGRRR